MHEITDARLEAILRSVGDHLDVGDEAPVARVRSIARRPGRHRHLVGAAAALLVVVAVGLALAPVRRTVATWLSIGDTEITMQVADHTSDPSGLPTLVDGAERYPLEEAAPSIVPGDAVRGTPLGPPDGIAVPAEGGVLLLWSQGSTTLWIRRPDVDAGTLFRKLVDVGDDVGRVDRLGDGALAVRGVHVLVTPSRRVAANTVLLWTERAREYRLESDLPLDEMITVARAIDAED